jgi:hypothetical protein
MTMGTFTKIFLQFPKKFWFDTEVNSLTDTSIVILTLLADGTLRGPGAWAISRLAEYGLLRLFTWLRNPLCDGYCRSHDDTASPQFIFACRAISRRESKLYLTSRYKQKSWEYFVLCIPILRFQTLSTLPSRDGTRTRCIVDHSQTGLRRSSVNTMIT